MRLSKPVFHFPLNMIYAEAQLLPEIRRSLNFVLLGNIFGNMFGIICGTGSNALIGLANYLGANDFMFGLISGIPMAAALLQIPFSILVSRTHKRKKYMLTFGIFSRALWILFGIVPFILPAEPAWLPLWTILFLLGISSGFGSFINVSWMPWLADLAPIGIRGRWISFRDSVNAVGGVSFGLLVAYMLDTIPGLPKYTIVFALGGTLGVLDMICYAFVKEVYGSLPVSTRILAVGKRIMKDKTFMRFMVFWTAWSFTVNLSGSYLNRYSLNEMGLSYMQLTLFGSMAASLITILTVTRWGRLMDRYGCKPVLWIAGIAASLMPGFYLFSVYGSIWPVFLYNFIGSAFLCAANLAANSMQLSYSPDDNRPSYIAFFSCVTSLAGSFFGVVSGGAILEMLQSLAVAMGYTYDRYKILIALSIAARFAVVLLFVPKIHNDRQFTVRDMLRGKMSG